MTINNGSNRLKVVRMKKIALSFLLILMAFHCFITPPVEAKKKYLTLKELKVCAQESIALSSLWEEYEKAKKWSDLQYKNAEKLYNDTEAKKNELNTKMNN